MSIPDDLLERLHRNNEQFHRARLHLDEVDGIRVKPSQAAVELHAAEVEWEQITREIQQHLHGDDRRR